MRHGKKINHLSRTSSHRRALLSNMASSLILHKRIHTTLAKAKALRVYVEPLLTKSKNDSTHSRRVVFSYLHNKDAVSTLFRDVAVKIANRPGGYTIILKTGNRHGDNASMCFIELVDYNENMLMEKQPAKAKAARTRRGSKKTKTVEASAASEQTIEVKPTESKTESTETKPKKAKKKDEGTSEENKSE